MTDDEIRQVTEERLGLWGARMVQYHSTPLMALSVGHDHVSGQLNVHITEDLPDEYVREVVAWLFEQVCVNRCPISGR